MFLELIALIFVVWFFVTISMGGDEWAFVFMELLDAPTWLMILVSVLPALLICRMWKDFIRAVKLQRKSYTCSLNEMKKAQYAVEFLRKSLLWGGVIMVLLGLMTSFYNLSFCDFNGDWRALGLSLVLVEVPLICVAMLEFLLLPLEIVVKRRILEFMEEE